MTNFPDLSIPTSPTSPTSPNGPSQESFFTPPRKVEVFARLTQKSGEAGHNARNRDLVERCREVWGITSRREKERELEGVIKRWSDTIGTREEIEWGKTVAEGVRDLLASMGSGEPLPPVLQALLGNLLALLKTSVGSIFPLESICSPPSPSMLHILKTTGPALLAEAGAKKTIAELGDEIKGGAVGEYVMIAGDTMGGMDGMNGGAMRNVGDSGKDRVVEGFETAGRWIEEEIGSIRKIWGNGLGSYVVYYNLPERIPCLWKVVESCGKLMVLDTRRALNPAAIILSRQLPLYLAELQVLDKPRHGAAADVFGLYEMTGRLLSLWEELCPG